MNITESTSGVVPGLLPCYSLLCRESDATPFYRCYSVDCPRRPPNTSAPKVHNACTQVCCSKFANYQDEPLSSVYAHDLSGRSDSFTPINNPILPLFDQGKFRDFDYTLLEEPLRLASLLLQSPGACEYITTMADGDIAERYFDPQNGKHFWDPTTWAKMDASGYSTRKGFSWFRKSPKPEHVAGTTDVQARAKEVLQRLSRTVTEYYLLDEPGSNGMCECDPRPMTANTVQAFPRGGCTSIGLSRTSYMALYDLRKRQRRSNIMAPDKYRQKLLVTQFLLATTIVHEIGHALSVLCNGDRPEPFQNNNPLGESGYDLEHSIFGGVPSLFYLGLRKSPCAAFDAREEDNDLSDALVLREWPNWVTAHWYLKTRGAISILDDQMNAPNEANWRIPIKWIEQLFSQTFWAYDVPRFGKGALHPPRIAAWVFRVMLIRDKPFNCGM